MTTQSQAAGSETIKRVVPDVVGTPEVAPEVAEVTDILKSVDKVAGQAPAKKSLFGRSKDHVARNKGKYSFAAGVAIGAAAGIGYSIWKVGGVPAADLIGDTPV
jgi:hypothetical protein